MKLMSKNILDESTTNNLVTWYIAWDPYGLTNMGDAILYHIFKEVSDDANQNPSDESEKLKKEFKTFEEALGIRKGLKRSVVNVLRVISQSEAVPGLIRETANVGEKTISELETATVIRKTLESLNTYLNNKNIFVYFFIDEIDRSTGFQINSLFSELKAYLSQNRIAIILGYDESYVLDAIKGELPEGIDANEFIDKIITLRKNIPLPDLTSLKNIAFKYLEEHSVLNYYLDDLSDYAANLCNWNPRRLKRILLSFKQHMPEEDIGGNNFICLLIMTALDESGLLKYREFSTPIQNDDTSLLITNLSSFSVPKLRDEAKCICDAIEKLNVTSRFTTSSVRNLGLPVFRQIRKERRIEDFRLKKYDWKPQIFKIFTILSKQDFVVTSDFINGNEELQINEAEKKEIGREILRQIPIFRRNIAYFSTPEYDLYIVFTEQNARIAAEIFAFITATPHVVKKKPVTLWIIDDGDLLQQNEIDNFNQSLDEIMEGLKHPAKIICTKYDQIESLVNHLFSQF